MFPAWVWILLLLGGIFLALSTNRYRDLQSGENHDSYLLVHETCEEGRLMYKKCPNLDMWGLKFSVIVTLLVINTILVLALYHQKNL